MSLILSGCQTLYDHYGGAFEARPWELDTRLSPEARALVDEAFEDIDPERLVDYHVHLLTGDFHPSWRSCLYPLRYARTRVYLSASGVSPCTRDFKRDYVGRLMELIEGFPIAGRFYLYAMDYYYDPDGKVNHGRTSFYVSNEAVYELARQWPDRFVPVISVHPFRTDALDQLDRWAARGVRHVKWIPNSMGINPADPRIHPFYVKMAAHDMVLLSHTGDERAIEVDEQEWGNPLRLQVPLELGVKVVALHSASDGVARDLETSGAPSVPAFNLLLRMLDNPRYEGRLFAEISAMVFFNHIGPPLDTLLTRSDLHHRLVNGSDYPFCALNATIRPGQLAELDYLSSREAEWLKEIYHVNPLLCDFVVKRTVRHPQTGAKFAAEVFHVPEAIR